VKWIDFFKQYRDILESDIIHVRRPDGRGLDCILHVNPNTKPRALAMVYNPLDHPVTKTIALPLYYAGLTDEATIQFGDSTSERYRLDRLYKAHIVVEVPASGNAWVLIE
jgi:hypothetical protein